MLEAKVAELTKDLKTEMSSRGLVTVGTASSSSSALSLVGQSVDAHRMEGLDGFSAIEMYNRVAATERELSVEKGKRREADLYLVSTGRHTIHTILLTCMLDTIMLNFSAPHIPGQSFAITCSFHTIIAHHLSPLFLYCDVSEPYFERHGTQRPGTPWSEEGLR